MKRYGILANPAKHSLSPVMHNAAFKALHMRAHYEIFEVPENELAKFMKFVRNEPIEGLSVSLPYKEKVMQYLDKINKEALKIGSVNTIVNSEGFLYGFNTDYLASNKALFIDMKGRHVPTKDPIAVVIGAGGAARAVCYGLLKMGIHVWVANRTKEKADAIAIEFAEMFNEAEIHSNDLNDLKTGDILINTTSIWTKEPKIRIQNLPYFCSSEYVRKFKLVMDLCYNPLETPLIKAAKRIGIEYVTGDKMLLYQAVDQFELWTGKKPPVEVMRDALEAEL
ncbi:shikimate dehydrogenase [Candidatus Peregrinibacteria bacterium]|nr:shikimate dehydrogenase [Candidatus Peregrinibacteria bacterium]